MNLFSLILETLFYSPITIALDCVTTFKRGHSMDVKVTIPAQNHMTLSVATHVWSVCLGTILNVTNIIKFSQTPY